MKDALLPPNTSTAYEPKEFALPLSTAPNVRTVTDGPGKTALVLRMRAYAAGIDEQATDKKTSG
ncbi:hypothetical protein N9094_01870 [bacterium]|nr:hypothetical protein [bacterium]MDB4772849.1 hypothetical protein [Verrucomicrobiales bacterium]